MYASIVTAYFEAAAFVITLAPPLSIAAMIVVSLSAGETVLRFGPIVPTLRGGLQHVASPAVRAEKRLTGARVADNCRRACRVGTECAARGKAGDRRASAIATSDTLQRCGRATPAQASVAFERLPVRLKAVGLFMCSSFAASPIGQLNRCTLHERLRRLARRLLASTAAPPDRGPGLPRIAAKLARSHATDR